MIIRNNILLNQKSISNQLQSYLNKIFFDKSTWYKSSIFGIFLIIMSIVFFSFSFRLNMKIGLTLFLIGFFLIILIPGKILPENSIDIKIIIIIITWILLMFLLTINVDLEILFVLILLGILLIKEFTDKLTSSSFKKRLNIFIFSSLLIFLVLVIKRIINF